MRKKLGILTLGAIALLVGPIALTAPPAEASTCASSVPVVCDVYRGVAGTLCRAVAKYADCIQ